MGKRDKKGRFTKGNTPWHKGTKGLMPSSKKGKTLEEIHGEETAKRIRKNAKEANVGKRHTKETRKKMSELRLGKKHPFYGKHHTEESVKKMSQSALNAYKIGTKKPSKTAFKKGHTPLNKNKTYEESYGKKRAEEMRETNKLSRLGKNNVRFGTRHSAATLKKMRMKKLGKRLSKTTRSKLAKRWENEDFRKRVLGKREMSSLEVAMQKIIDKNKLPFIFVGNGDVAIEGKTPDFVHSDGEKIALEVFSTYHKNRTRPKEGGYIGWRRTRTTLARKHGWKILYFDADKKQITEKHILKVMKKHNLYINSSP
jgi:hypothetical protein